MGSKKSFVVYTAWKSFFELLDEPALVRPVRVSLPWDIVGRALDR